jgi:predicted O-methyltransferase YrrM
MHLSRTQRPRNTRNRDSVSDRRSDLANTTDFRRGLRRSAPQTELDAIHTSGCVVVPSREVLLERLPQGGTVAEVGVAEGEFSRAILQRNRPRKLHLIDLWDTDRYRAGLDAIRNEHAALIADGAVVIHQGRSLDRLASFADASLDWVYIDTDHSYALTLAELRLAATKVRPDGFIAGHDYSTGNVIAPWPYGVVEACHQFCAEANWRFAFLALEARGRMSFALSRLPAEMASRRP